jgi:uncharacterized FlgJ-related protein
MIYSYCEKTLKFKPVLHKCFGFILLAFTIISIVAYNVGHIKGFKNGKKSLSDKEKTLIIKEQDLFTEEKLKNYLLELNVKFPHIVYAQAVIESGNFTSQIFKNNNNLFGMKQARRRATTNAGTELGHAVYHHWRESVLDYALYQCAFLSNIYSEDDYYQYLKENYAESSQYAERVKSIADKL